MALTTVWEFNFNDMGNRSAGIACWQEHQTHDRKVVSSNPSRSSGRIYFSRVNFVCWLLLRVRFTPMLPQWHIKDPVLLPKVQVAGYTEACIHPWPNEVGVGWLCPCPEIVWEPIQKQPHMQLLRKHLPSHLSILSPCGLILAGMESGISVCELISTEKTQTKKMHR